MSQLPLPPAARTLGASGIEVSPLAWGMWRLAENGRTTAEAAQLVHAALDAGITFLDTADIYGFNGSGGFGDAEALLGEVLEPVTLGFALAVVAVVFLGKRLSAGPVAAPVAVTVGQP